MAPVILVRAVGDLTALAGHQAPLPSACDSEAPEASLCFLSKRMAFSALPHCQTSPIMLHGPEIPSVKPEKDHMECFAPGSFCHLPQWLIPPPSPPAVSPSPPPVHPHNYALHVKANRRNGYSMAQKKKNQRGVRELVRSTGVGGSRWWL